MSYYSKGFNSGTDNNIYKLLDLIEHGKSGRGFAAEHVNQAAELIKELYDYGKGHEALVILASSQICLEMSALRHFLKARLQHYKMWGWRMKPLLMQLKFI